jgi:hypothetical protein
VDVADRGTRVAAAAGRLSARINAFVRRVNFPGCAAGKLGSSRQKDLAGSAFSQVNSDGAEAFRRQRSFMSQKRLKERRSAKLKNLASIVGRIVAGQRKVEG